MTPARTVAAGALAGGMLLLSAFLPAHALDGARDAGKAQAPQAHQARAAEKETTPRRKPLKASARRECGRIDAAIRANEETERRGGARGVMESLEQDAQSLRKRYRELGC
ncbi:hypothetical protein [Massilia sp.]|uniref:hypothetical protein n=1 Tax=Massilia sp. TaxID=1882437 RepID=UPI00289CE1AE|nr:hypothetical protein [Massilia sp.]